MMQKITPYRLRELLDYDATSGVVSRRTSGKPLEADFAGFVSIYDPEAKKTTKLKMKNAIWDWLGYTLEDGSVVFQRNMQEDDFSSRNLVLLSKINFLRVKEAYRNINESIKLTSHPVDMFSNVLHWYQNGAMRSKVIRDVHVAKREMLKLKLHYSKVLTAYCVFD